MQKSIRYIAIDDSPVDLMILKEYASSYPFLEHCGSFGGVKEALAGIGAARPDLVFLDIEMPGLSGIDLLREIKSQISIAIFITSHPEFALEGFELSALDYILKPLTEERFAESARRITDYWDMKQKSAAYEILFEKGSLTIKDGHNQIRLPQQDIIYLEAMQDYTKVVTEKKSYLTLATLTGFLEKLPVDQFLRVHRSYAVSRNKIRELHFNKIICGDTTIPIGKTYRATVNQIKL